MTYEKSFKEEAARLSDEIGVKKAAKQLGVPYYTLVDWRQDRKRYSTQAYVGSRHKRALADPKEHEFYDFEKKMLNCVGQMRFCRRRWVFSPKAERSKSTTAIRIRGRAYQQMAGHGAVPRTGDL